MLKRVMLAKFQIKNPTPTIKIQKNIGTKEKTVVNIV